MTNYICSRSRELRGVLFSFWLGAVGDPRESLDREGCWREKMTHRVGGGRDLEIRWKRKPWTKGRAPLPPAQEEGWVWVQLDVGVTLASCRHFPVVAASVVFVTQEVR